MQITLSFLRFENGRTRFQKLLMHHLPNSRRAFGIKQILGFFQCGGYSILVILTNITLDYHRIVFHTLQHHNHWSKKCLRKQALTYLPPEISLIQQCQSPFPSKRDDYTSNNPLYNKRIITQVFFRFLLSKLCLLSQWMNKLWSLLPIKDRYQNHLESHCTRVFNVRAQ